MGWFKNMVKNWLNIEKNTGISICIQENNTHEGNCFENELWYRGDASELHQYYTQFDDLTGNSRFWSAENTEGIKIRKIHTGLPKIMVTTLSDILIENFNGIEIKNNNNKNKIWEKIAEENMFQDLIYDMFIDLLVMGDGAFKIRYDTAISQLPILEFYPAKDVEYEYIGKRIKAIIFKIPYILKGNTYILKEKYQITGNNSVTYKLYDNNDKEVDINNFSEFDNLKSITNNDFPLAVPVIPIKSKKFKGRGESIFEGKKENFDSYDEVWSQWIEAIRDNKTITYIPEDLIPRNSDGQLLKPNAFDRRFVKIDNSSKEGDHNTVQRENSNFDYEGMLKSYVTALDLCLQGKISPSTLGIDSKKLDNADAQREKEKATLNTIKKYIRVLTPVLKKIVQIAINTYEKANEETITELEVDAKFAEYANSSFEAVIETVAKARPGQAVMSIERSVEELYGDSLTKEEKEKEVQRLKEEAGILQRDEPGVI